MIVSTIHSSNCMGINLSVGILISWRILITGEFLLNREKILMDGLLILHLGKAGVGLKTTLFLWKVLFWGVWGTKKKITIDGQGWKEGAGEEPPSGKSVSSWRLAHPPTTHISQQPTDFFWENTKSQKKSKTKTKKGHWRATARPPNNHPNQPTTHRSF